LLARHGAEEGEILAEYERLAASTTDPAARYLLDLILADERHHHRMLVQLATAMAWETLMTCETSVPSLGWQLDAGLVDATRKLIEHEEKDRHELQILKKRLRLFKETTLWSLMVDLMLRDTEKHTAILSFLERHAAGN